MRRSFYLEAMRLVRLTWMVFVLLAPLAVSSASATHTHTQAQLLLAVRAARPDDTSDGSDGVEKDLAEARDYLQKAADTGSKTAKEESSKLS